MSADRFFLQRRIRDLDESPAYEPISRVRIHAGEDGDGNPIVYEAGNTTGRTIDIDNPLIMDKASGRTIAANVLDAIQGYAYKPYRASDALLDPAAEIGDAVSVGEVYSVLADIETTFSPLMTANIGAREDGSIDHEYPYESSEDRKMEREVQALKTSFIVENGRIAAEISGVQETASGLSTKITDLEITVNGIHAYTENDIKTIAGQEINSWASFNFTPENISSQVSSYFDASGTAAGYYEDLTKEDGTLDRRDAAIKAEYQSEISQTARSIEATVAESETKYDLTQLPDGVSISIYGYGNPNGVVPAGGTNRNKYYLDQTNGRYYQSNGTSWVVQTGQLELITNQLKAALSINAGSISSLLTSSSEHGNAISSIKQMIDSITLSISSDIYGQASFELGYIKDDDEGGGKTYAKLASNTFDVYVDSMHISGEVIASSVAAGSFIQSPIIYDANQFGALKFVSQSASGQMLYGNQYSSLSNAAFGVSYDPIGGNGSVFINGVRLASGSPGFSYLVLGDYGITVYAYGTWDFTNATVLLPS